MFKKGDRVVRTDYMGLAQEYICRSDEFKANSGTMVIFLEGMSGYFATEYLRKVNS